MFLKKILTLFKGFISDRLKNKLGMPLVDSLYSLMFRFSREDNNNQLKYKNKKLHRLILEKPINRDNYKIPVVDLCSHELDVSGLKYGLHQSFTDKNRIY